MIPIPALLSVKNVIIATAAVFLLWLAYFAYSTISGWHEDSKELAVCSSSLETQKAAAIKQKEQADEYFTELDGVNRELARVKRVRPARCICPKTSAARSCPSQASSGNELHQANGVTTDALYEFAADAERVRQQLISCQKWVRE